MTMSYAGWLPCKGCNTKRELASCVRRALLIKVQVQQSQRRPHCPTLALHLTKPVIDRRACRWLIGKIQSSALTDLVIASGPCANPACRQDHCTWCRAACRLLTYICSHLACCAPIVTLSLAGDRAATPRCLDQARANTHCHSCMLCVVLCCAVCNRHTVQHAGISCET